MVSGPRRTAVQKYLSPRPALILDRGPGVDLVGQISRNATVSRFRVGDFDAHRGFAGSGTTIRTLVAFRAMAKSCASVTIRATLMPGPGANSYMVMTGPGCTSVTFPAMPEVLQRARGGFGIATPKSDPSAAYSTQGAHRAGPRDRADDNPCPPSGPLRAAPLRAAPLRAARLQPDAAGTQTLSQPEPDRLQGMAPAQGHPFSERKRPSVAHPTSGGS